MNNPSNSAALLRTLIVYAICVPLASVVGFLLANQWDYSTFAVAGVLAGLLMLPVLIRAHHYLLLLSWNATLVIFFLKGSPKIWLVMVALSLGIAVVNRAINPRHQFLHVPQITWPLIFLTAVVLATAELTGGFGLRTLGSDVYGGKKYIFTMVSIFSYFALTSQRIPPKRAGLAVGLFFLGGMTGFFGDLYYLIPAMPEKFFWLFPPSERYGTTGIEAMRLGGVAALASAVSFYLLARYGIRGIFLSGKPWLLLFFFTFAALGLLSGHRALLATIGGIFMIQFYLEGLHRTKLLPLLLFCGLAGFVAMIPLASKLPLTIQRAMSFLPVDVSYEARSDAAVSVEWRYAMWDALLPQVEPHLLLGKGYAFAKDDYEMMGRDSAFTAIDASQQGLALAGDYHSGWLSVLITFGVWGMIGIFWLFGAGIYVLHRNYRYGDPALWPANCFLLADFIIRILFFLTVGGGGLHSDLFFFVGDLGLSITLNGGLCRPATEPVPAVQTLIPATATKFLPRTRPVFQR